MKWIYIFLGFCGLPLSLAAEGVDHLIADAEQLEQRGETDSAINVLKNAEHSSPENIQVEKLLARQYVMKVDDATDPAVKKTYAEMARELAQKAAQTLPNDSEPQLQLPAPYVKLYNLFDAKP